MSLRRWSTSYTSDRPIRLTFALLMIVVLCSASLASLPSLPSLTRVAEAAPISHCEAQIFDGTYPDPAGTITPLRRQPFAGTIATTPTLTVAGNTILLQTGQVNLSQLKTTLDTYASQTFTTTALFTQTKDLLQETSSNVWLLRGNLQIAYTAALSVVGNTNSPMTLRIESTDTITPPLSIFNRGYLRFEDAKLTSWDTPRNGPDTNYHNGRAYVVAFEGGRMDFYRSDVGYLGWKDGEASGIAWRKCADENNQATGATGDIHDSDIHHNLFGMYSYEAFGIWAKNNIVRDSEYYGFDPHDYSDYFIFENNRVYNNGKHGIIFSRWCDYNIIRNNIVYDNVPKPGNTNTIAHGIFLDRRSTYNQIIGNTVYNQMDGIAIFQSQYNIIKDNTVYNSLTGIRINATPVPMFNGLPDRTADQKSLYNKIINNTVRNNRDYGIYLYNRADNTTITGNTITDNGRRDAIPGVALGSGIHIKTGGNEIRNNIIKDNGHGVSLMEVDANPDPVGDGDDTDQPGTQPNVEPGLPTGSQNIVANNTISGSKGRGVRMVGADSNTIQENDITASRDEGIYSDGGNNNRFLSNYVHQNGLPDGTVSDEGIPDVGNYGVNIKGVNAKGNFMSQNRITGNGRAAIKLGTGTNNDIVAPEIIAIQPTQISGRGLPGATIEVFRDPLTGCGTAQCGDEAAEYVGSAVADATTGIWTLVVPTQGGYSYAATQTSNNNSSELSRTELSPTITVGLGRKGEQTIYVDGTGAELSLYQVKAGLDTYADTQGKPEYKALLTDDGLVEGKRTWTLKASLFISPTVSLFVKGGAAIPQAERVDWLRLFSNPGPDPKPNPLDPDHPIFDATKFATIKTYSGNLYFEDTRVTSWDTGSNRLDEELRDGRAFVLAKYDSEMNIIRSDMSYLGYADGEAYGLSWRDVDPTTNKDGTPYSGEKRIRVTGQVIDSIISHNYYGIYTFQARDMVFRNNKLFSHIQYGFDPHDFTHDVIVEGNEAYDNGSHGFIISRGCSNFVFRNNISRDNKVKPGSKNPSAHGFMLDPGADFEKAGVPQVPSVFNLIDSNQAYGNDGYAVRVYGSNDNVIRNNLFYNNRAGITIEKGSTRNLVIGNTIRDNTGEQVVDPMTGLTTIKSGYGVYTLQGADGNTISENIITNNINTGIYLKSGNNVVHNNRISNNGGDGIGTLLEVESETPADPPTVSSSVDAALVPGAYIADQEPGDWSIAMVSLPTNNSIISNTIELNFDSGISLKGASNTLVENNFVAENGVDGIYIANGSVDTLVRANIVRNNKSYGIKANGSTVERTHMTQNIVTRNNRGGIAVTSGANGGIVAPKMEVVSIDASKLMTNAVVGSWIISGTTLPNALVELYSDSAQQAAEFLGTAQADGNGAFSFVTNGQPWGLVITATVTDGAGNTSALSKPAKNGNIPWLSSDYVVFMPVMSKQ